MGFLAYINRLGTFFLTHLTFSNREFQDSVYYNLKIGYIVLQLVLIAGDVVFACLYRQAYCYYNSDFAGVLKIHEVMSTMIMLFAVLHALDILYQKMEMSYEGEPQLKRYVKILFGFTPIKFFGWYAGVLWVTFGSLAYECSFHDPQGEPSQSHYQYEESPQKVRAIWIIVELTVGGLFLVLFVILLLVQWTVKVITQVHKLMTRQVERQWVLEKVEEVDLDEQQIREKEEIFEEYQEYINQ